MLGVWFSGKLWLIALRIFHGGGFWWVAVLLDLNILGVTADLLVSSLFCCFREAQWDVDVLVGVVFNPPHIFVGSVALVVSVAGKEDGIGELLSLKKLLGYIIL